MNTRCNSRSGKDPSRGARLRIAIVCERYVSTSSVYALLEDLEQIGTPSAIPGEEHKLFECALVSERPGVIEGACNMRLQTDESIECASGFSAIIVPAYYAPPLGWREKTGEPTFPRALVEWLTVQHADGALLCGVLTGTYAIAATGLLDGQRASTHWIELPWLNYWHPTLLTDPHQPVSIAGEDGRIITIGVNGAFHNDLADYLVARLCGADCLATVYGMRGRSPASGVRDAHAWLMARGSRFDALVRDAQQWLAEHYASQDLVQKLADHLQVSTRMLSRRFKSVTGLSPLGYAQSLRIVASQRELERSDRPIEDVAMSVGYNDVATYRALFREQVGKTPAAYRRAFGRTN